MHTWNMLSTTNRANTYFQQSQYLMQQQVGYPPEVMAQFMTPTAFQAYVNWPVELTLQVIWLEKMMLVEMTWRGMMIRRRCTVLPPLGVVMTARMIGSDDLLAENEEKKT